MGVLYHIGFHVVGYQSCDPAKVFIGMNVVQKLVR